MSPVNNTPTIGKFSWKEKSILDPVAKKNALLSEDETDEHLEPVIEIGYSPEEGDRDSKSESTETNDNEEDTIARRRSRRTRSITDDSSNNSERGAVSPTPRGKKLRIHQPTMMFQCDHCGKVYKHRNCLVKHGWEHHESWHLTVKHCSTKHQQVQMMEAAHALSAMNGMNEIPSNDRKVKPSAA